MQKLTWPGVLRSRVFVWVVIPLFWLLAYWPALGVRDMRLEEGRRATPAAEMLRSGNWVVPTLYGEAYLNKPPLFFWIAAGMGKFFGGGEVTTWSVRVPSVLSVLLGAWLLVWFGRGVLAREVRVLAALFFMSMPIMLDKGTLGEIDAVLSLVTFAAVAVWWKFYDTDRGRVCAWGWIGAGVLLGMSVLMKGPGGAAEFYAVVAGFVLLKKPEARSQKPEVPLPNGPSCSRWWLLFSPWHVVMLLIALVPVGLWIKTLLAETGMSWADLMAIWSRQTGVDMIAGGGGEGWKKILVDHYVMFGLRAAADVMPWVAVGMIGAWKPEARSQKPEGGKERDLWRMVVAAWPMLLVIFWIWPKGSPRYMMMGAYPVAVLAAWVVARRWEAATSEKVLRFLRTAGTVMTLAVGMIGGAAIVLTPRLTGIMIAVLVASMVLAVWAHWLARRTPAEGLVMAAAANLALVVLLGWGMMTAVVLPMKAKTDATRIIHEQIQARVPAGLPIYTTRTFSHGADFYNEQFYLPGGARALRDFSQLPAKTRVIVILLPEEWESLKMAVPDAVIVGSLDATENRPGRKGAPAAVIVAEAMAR
ncbi:MAG: glycosyltransferase family 39 protein [Phycisphaerales bacterium]|nr:glycosyltransferase family 39 protein [Phycisphaerales bacterium]